VGFGQGISVTPLQLLSAYCTVANGGWQIQPRVISAVTGPGGEIERLSRPDPVRILSANTCERMRRMLIRAVEDGTGIAAQVPGHQVAGKTGTAQKATLGEGYQSDKYIASFAGFAPADRPRLAILVTVDEPQSSHYGATVAAPAFRAICERSLIHLRVPPDRPFPRHEIALAAGRAEPR
jgi:cell division protein FtsI/penicillin-binding protein 2